MRALRTSVSGGDLEKALELVGEKGEPGDLLYHLERGALLHYLERHAESNGDLESAEQVLDERYTVSLSERGLTFLLNDEIEAYAGEVHEGNYLHYYRTLNFLAREERAAAAVEARRLALRLSELRERQSEDLSVRDDPFLEYLAGAVLESVGEWNGALISYRLAKGTYAEWEREAARPVFPWLEQDIVRTARLSGIDLREIGLVPAERDRAADASMDGQLLVLFECGWTPRKVSKHLRIPIFECDRGGEDEGAALETGRVLTERYQCYRKHGYWTEQSLKLAYYLDVAIPVLVPDTESEAVEARVSLSPRGSAVGGEHAEAEVHTVLAADIARLVERVFEGREFAVLAKTFARALLKYVAHHEAEENLGVWAGILANIAGAATEKADTRSWLLLPAQVQIARIHLPAGEYALCLEALDGRGRVLEIEEREVRVAPGEIRIVSWRSFR
jgi:hypothetical protein